ncbi:hypothetical protein ACFO0N_16120 [Halobium salinum]|uniref:HVO-0234-like beta-propeller domain-containing protein n=1 Tax=Halobium salinum TaxID=1364940 RepID=A0ABD5PFQ0_9EURY|nr:hypothetical protein [Halobium salinum]
MTSIDEKRVYDDKGTKTQAVVATETGVVVVDVSDDLVGGFTLAHRCTARDVATHEGHIAVATDVDVLEARPGGDVEAGIEFESAGYGPAVDVAYDADGRLLVAEKDGTVVARNESDADDGDAEWAELGDAGTVREIDGPLAATADGVYRVGDDDLEHVGLDDARDVAGAGGVIPLAATSEGLFKLGNGWMDLLDGECYAVAAAGDRGLAAGMEMLYADDGDGEWTELDDLPVDEPVADVALSTEARYAVTEAGTVLVDAGDGWRSQALGLEGVARLAVR